MFKIKCTYEFVPQSVMWDKNSSTWKIIRVGKHTQFLQTGFVLMSELAKVISK